MSNPRIEVSANKQVAAAGKQVAGSLDSVKDAIRKANSELNVLTRSMQTFGRTGDQALRGVSRGFSEMFKNANREADALINKMRQMQGLFSKNAPTLFGPNGQVVVGPGFGGQQPGSMPPPSPIATPPPVLYGPNGQVMPSGGGQGGGGQGGGGAS